MTLTALLAALALTLPFPKTWTDTVLVRMAPAQEQPGWLGYACPAEQEYDYPATNVVCPAGMQATEVLQPALVVWDAPDHPLMRNVVAHESYHLYFGGAHGSPDDPNDERGAYAFGCVASYVPMCDALLSPLTHER